MENFITAAFFILFYTQSTTAATNTSNGSTGCCSAPLGGPPFLKKLCVEQKVRYSFSVAVRKAAENLITAAFLILFCIQSTTAAGNTSNGSACCCSTPLWQSTRLKKFLCWAKSDIFLDPREGCNREVNPTTQFVSWFEIAPFLAKKSSELQSGTAYRIIGLKLVHFG